QLETRMARFELRPLGLGFLHTIFAEHPLARGDDGLDRVGRKRLADGHERHRRRFARSLSASRLDVMPHAGERDGRIVQMIASYGISSIAHGLERLLIRIWLADPHNFSNSFDRILTERNASSASWG